jgi:hypothetical protein
VSVSLSPDSVIDINNTDPNKPILMKLSLSIMPSDTSQYQYFMTSCHKVLILPREMVR